MENFAESFSPYLSEKLREAKPYDPGLNTARIHLDANESCMELTDAMKKKIADAMLELHFNRYPDALATEVCERFGLRYRVPPRFVTAGNGSDELLALLFGAVCSKGDKVLLTEPDFSMYRVYCKTYECEPVIVAKNSAFCFDPDELIETANSERVRLILFSNPCNPTGQGIPREDVLRIVEKSNCLVAVDEAYMDFWDQSVLEAATAAPNLIVLRTASKIGFAAGRLGFAVANSQITDCLRAVKSPYNINAFTQAAACVFFGEPGYLDGAVDAIRRSRDRLLRALRELEQAHPKALRVYETHTNFVLCRVTDPAAVYEALLAFGISVRHVAGCLRITAGTAEENREFVSKLGKILEAGEELPE